MKESITQLLGSDWLKPNGAIIDYSTNPTSVSIKSLKLRIIAIVRRRNPMLQIW